MVSEKVSPLGPVIESIVYGSEILSRCNEATVEFSRCIEFRVFLELVNNCRIYEEDDKAHSAHYKSLNEKRGNQYQDRKKPYDALANNRKQNDYDGKKTCGGGAPTFIK